MAPFYEGARLYFCRDLIYLIDHLRCLTSKRVRDGINIGVIFLII